MASLDLDTILEQLSDSRSESAIQVLMHRLPTETARDLRLCAIPHVFDDTILRVLEPVLTEAEARERCRGIAALAPIVIRDDGYALHDSARAELFQEWLAPEGRADLAAASARLVEHHTRAIASGRGARAELEKHRMFHLLGADLEAGFREFERVFLLARDGYSLADCEQLARLVHEYDTVLPPEIAIQLRYHEGTLAVELRLWDDANRLLASVLDSKDSSPLLRARALNRLGKMYADRHEWGRAVAEYNKAWTIVQMVQDPGDITYRLLHDLGIVERENGDIEAADRLLTLARRRAEDARDERYIAVCGNSLGSLRHRSSRFNEAIALFWQSVAILERLGDRFALAQIYNNLGMVHLDCGQVEESRRCFLVSLESARAAKVEGGQGRVLANLARAQQALGDLTTARETAQQAFARLLETRDNLGAGLAKRQEARILRAENRREQAKQAYELSIPLLDETAPREASAARAELTSLSTRGLRLPWYCWTAIAIALAGVGIVVAIAVSS